MAGRSPVVSDAAAGHRVEFVDIDTLRPHPENPKAHDINVVRESMRRFGFTQPILVCERTGYIAAGHGRRAALMAERGEGKQMPEGLREGPEGQWLVPVVMGWSSKDDVELRALLIADNRTTELGGWDTQTLATNLELISDSDFGLLGVGFSEEELVQFVKNANPTSPGAFPAIDPNTMDTEYRCPSCGYEWSGQPKPGEPTHEPPTGDSGGDDAPEAA